MAGGGGGLFVDVGLMLVEGRVAERQNARGHREGPHCPQLSPPTAQPQQHICSDSAFLCERAGKLRRHMSLLSDNSVPMCIDVFLCPECPCGQGRAAATNICSVPSPTDLLLEQWTVSLVTNKCSESGEMDGKGLLQAIRSQLYFSQLSSWYSLGMVKPVCYRLSHPGTARSIAAFTRPPTTHNFPLAPTPRGSYVKVSVKSLPRMEGMSTVDCPVHSSTSPLAATVTVFKSVFAELGHCLLDPPSRIPPPLKHGLGSWRDNRTPSPPPPARPASRSYQRSTRSNLIPRGVVDDRLQSGCQHIGKHHCQDDSTECQSEGSPPQHTCTTTHNNTCLLQAGSDKECQKEASAVKYLTECVHRVSEPVYSVYRSEVCSKGSVGELEGCEGAGCTNRKVGIVAGVVAGAGLPPIRHRVNPLKRKRQQLKHNSKKLLSEEQHCAVAGDLIDSFNSLNLGAQFLKPQVRCSSSGSVEARGIAVPTRRPQLFINTPSPSSISPSLSPPSPSPLHLHNQLSPSCVDGIRTVTDSSSEDTECESPVRVTPLLHVTHSSKSATSLLAFLTPGSGIAHTKSTPLFRPSLPLLGNIEESILNGRVKPLSVVECGYTLDLGASGTFCPKHLTLPVTVSFYPVLGLSAPYMGVVKLSKKGYHVPRSGTIQATLLNPLGTVIKMFVVGYDLTDMPSNCHTFLRQRLLTLPSTRLRYLIHLRFSSSKSGRVFLHTDIRVMICRQYDMDTSVELDVESGCQLRCVNVAPFNPKYSAITK